MAYFTKITALRDFTEAERTQLTNYVEAQTTAGTTDGNVYNWLFNNDSDVPQNVRMWSTSESATGYQAVLAGFSPAVPVSVY